MGNLFSGGSGSGRTWGTPSTGYGGGGSTTGGGGSNLGGRPGSPGGGYPADNARRMPVFNSPESLEAGRRRRREIMSRQGRESTRLVGNAGTLPFSNSFLGDVS